MISADMKFVVLFFFFLAFFYVMFRLRYAWKEHQAFKRWLWTGLVVTNGKVFRVELINGGYRTGLTKGGAGLVLTGFEATTIAEFETAQEAKTALDRWLCNNARWEKENIWRNANVTA